MDLSAIGEVLGFGASVASGGLFGLVGSVFSWWAKSQEAKAKLEQQRAQWQHDERLFVLQMRAKSQEGSWTGLSASLQDEEALNKQENYKWVVAVKALFRPFLTTFLWVLVVVEAHYLMTGQMDQAIKRIAEGSSLFSLADLQKIASYIVYGTVFSAMTATVWWFGERALMPADLKNR